MVLPKNLMHGVARGDLGTLSDRESDGVVRKRLSAAFTRGMTHSCILLNE
jgi:hypothetical protein